jgi:hypothetical protein
MKTIDMNFSNFTHVDAGYACEVEIIQSDSYGVSITAGDNIIKSVKVVEEDGTLKIRRTLSSLHGLIPGTFNAKITMPVLSRLDLSGACKGNVGGFSSENDFTINLKGASSLDIVNMSAGDVKFKLVGASKVNGQITAGNAEFNIEGAGRVKLEGSAKNMVIDAIGASHVDLATFQVGNADVKLQGASHSTINTDGNLDANLSGASKLYWLGKPVMGNIKTFGASTVSSK